MPMVDGKTLAEVAKEEHSVETSSYLDRMETHVAWIWIFLDRMDMLTYHSIYIKQKYSYKEDSPLHVPTHWSSLPTHGSLLPIDGTLLPTCIGKRDPFSGYDQWRLSIFSLHASETICGWRRAIITSQGPCVASGDLFTTSRDGKYACVVSGDPYT